MGKLLDFIWRKRSWVGRAIAISIFVHIGLGVLAGFVVILRAFSKPQAQFTAAPPTRPALDPRKLEMKVRMQDLQKSGGRPRLTPRMITQRPTEVALPEIKQMPDAQKRKVQREVSSFGISGFGSGFGSGSGSGMGSGIGITLPRVMSGRCDPFERMRRLERAGGDEECEKAVQAALKWLSSTQNSDGSWGTQFPTAMTGLALLAFLGHCETPTQGIYQLTVRRAIDWLASEGLRRANGGSGGHHLAYEYGIAAYALAEAYSMTREEKLIPVVQRAVGTVVGGQSSQGGWVYSYKSEGIDMSVTGWQVQALRAGQLTGLKIDGLEGAMKQAADGILKMAGPNGHFRYQFGRGDGKSTLTGAGLLSLLLLKEGSSKEVRDGFKAMLDSDEKQRFADAHLYAWYYNTQAAFAKGDPVWNKWRRTFQKQVIANQGPNGAWKAEGQGGAASSAAAKADAEIYRTALCALMLEVYYRYLPSGS